MSTESRDQFMQRTVFVSSQDAGERFATADAGVQAQFLMSLAKTIKTRFDPPRWAAQCQFIAACVEPKRKSAVRSCLQDLLDALEDDD